MSESNSELSIGPRKDTAIRALLLEHISQEPVRVRSKKRRAWWVAGGTVLLLAAGGATAGAIVLQAERASNAQYVFCLRSDDRAADGSYPGAIGATLASDDGHGRVEDAVELCTQMWLDGFFEPSFDPMASENPSGQAPPEFSACVMADGATAVVPSNRPMVCNRLGMAPLHE